MNKKILTALCILMVLSFSGVTPASGADLPGAAQLSQDNRCYAVQGVIHQTLNEDGNLAGSMLPADCLPTRYNHAGDKYPVGLGGRAGPWLH